MWDFTWQMFEKRNSKWGENDGYILRLFRSCKLSSSVNSDSGLKHEVCEREKFTLEQFGGRMS